LKPMPPHSRPRRRPERRQPAPIPLGQTSISPAVLSGFAKAALAPRASSDYRRRTRQAASRGANHRHRGDRYHRQRGRPRALGKNYEVLPASPQQRSQGRSGRPRLGSKASCAPPTLEMPRRIRINAVSPPWVKETLVKLGMDAASGLPSAEVAHAYVAAVEGTHQGQILAP
jgi:hypothetical protein